MEDSGLRRRYKARGPVFGHIDKESGRLEAICRDISPGSGSMKW